MNAYPIPQLGIEAEHVLTFSQNVASKAQQEKRRFEGTVRPEKVAGAMRMLRTAKKREMKDSFVRNADTQITSQDWVRRALIPKFSDDADLYDKQRDDLLTDLKNPSSSMVTNSVYARNRWIDTQHIKALLAPAIEQVGSEVTDIAPVDLPAVQVVPANLGGSTAAATNLHLGKLIKLRGAIAKSDDDRVVLGAENVFIAYTQAQLEYLLENVRQVSDSRYNDVKALVEGKINKFLGMTWIPSELLNLDDFRDDNGNVPTVVWAKTALSGGQGDCEVILAPRPDKKMGLQVLNLACCGFCREQDELVAVTYNGTAPLALA
jgi:hypothetical protein